MAQYQYNSDSDSQDCVSIILDKSGAKSVEVYPLKRITRDFNASMDKYFTWAFEVDGRWNYDDFNESSPPIDTQSIVSGTNRYKFSDFTEKIINVLRIEVLDSDGKGIHLTPEIWTNLDQPVNSAPASGRLNYITADTFQELYVNADSGKPTHYCKYGNFVYLRPKPNYDYADGLLAYFNRPAVYMASTDTTDIPGIVLTHIPLVCEMAANEFKHAKGIISLAEKLAFETYVKEIVQWHFSHRDKDIPNRIIPAWEDNK